MPPLVSNSDLVDTLAVVDSFDGNVSRAAEHLGLARSTIQNRLSLAEDRGIRDRNKLGFPDFVDGDEQIPVREIIRRKTEDFERTQRANAAKKWFRVTVDENRPYGIMMFGDPHLDDNGCHFPLLNRHIEVAKQEGIYGLNIGDNTNNWVGRLARLYGDQDLSETNAWRLAEWFMLDAGITWLCLVLGNHDRWSQGSELYKRIGANIVPVIDWRAQFKLRHPTRTEVRIDAAHGRKGSSIWNNHHSTLRAAKLGDPADLYVTGHTHNYACEHLEIADQSRCAWLVQLRGYKFMDSYAHHNGFAEYQHGSSVLAIIDPRKEATSRIHCFEDVQEGAEFLKWKRASAK